MPENDVETNDLFPEIVVDRKAKEYVATSEEDEAPPDDPPPPQKKPPAEEDKPDVPKVEKHLPKSRRKKEIFDCGDEPESPAEAESQPARRKKKPPSQQQLDHLAKIRVKALEAKRQKKAERERERSAKAEPEPEPEPKQPAAAAAQTPRTLDDAEVDVLIDRYKQRRKAKKAAKQAESQAAELIKSHYAPAEQPATKSWSDFF
eukprot:SAG22_NODE_1272_length_4923_cov_3.681385_2_plen_204_part_00